MNSKEFKAKVVPLSVRIYPMAARILNNNEDARDAVQDIMVKLWNNRTKLGSKENLNGYVFLTARNHCLDIVRKLKRNGTQLDIEAVYLSKLQINTGDNLEKEESYRLIVKAITNLPEKQKEVVYMRDIDGLEFEEIEAITGYKVENIRVWLSRARKRISCRSAFEPVQIPQKRVTASRRFALPSRWTKEETVAGGMYRTTPSTSPMSIPSSSVLVATQRAR